MGHCRSGSVPTTHCSRRRCLGVWKLGTSEQNDELLLDRPGWILPSWPKFPRYDSFAWQVHARRILRQCSKESLKNAITFLCAPGYAKYGTYLDLPHTVYHIHDAYWLTDGWDEHAQRRHLDLAERADWVFALSDTMLQNLPDSAVEKSTVLPQAVYAEQYVARSTEPCPLDIQDIPHPRIGYMGRISRKVDLDLVEYVALERPDWHWVFIGQTGVGFRGDPGSTALLEQIGRLPNVHILGPREQGLMPVYMANMDVNTMCYRLSGGQWEAGNPLKLFEYLAVGKPVIGTGLDNVRRYKHVIDIPNNKEEWVTAIERALESGGVSNVKERREVALENTWEKVVDQLEAKLFEIVGRKTETK